MLVALRPPARLQPARPVSSADFSFLERKFTPRTVFMEIGAADCSLALHAATYVERVYSVDVSGQFLHHVLVPCNVRLVLCDGVRIPVPAASVDLVWSGAFMDQLHPDDARDHLQNVRRSLLPGGEYLFTSANSGSLRERLLDAGFSTVSCWLGPARIPWAARRFVPRELVRVSARVEPDGLR